MLINFKNNHFPVYLTPGSITVITGGCRPLEVGPTPARGIEHKCSTPRIFLNYI